MKEKVRDLPDAHNTINIKFRIEMSTCMVGRMHSREHELLYAQYCVYFV